MNDRKAVSARQVEGFRMVMRLGTANRAADALPFQALLAFNPRQAQARAAQDFVSLCRRQIARRHPEGASIDG